MTKLITEQELEALEAYLINSSPPSLIEVTNEDFTNAFNNYHKLLSTYRYYKDRTIELELQIEDLVNRDFDL